MPGAPSLPDRSGDAAVIVVLRAEIAAVRALAATAGETIRQTRIMLDATRAQLRFRPAI